MIEMNTLMTFAAVTLGLFLIPGPAVLLVLARGMSGGRRVGVATGLGVVRFSGICCTPSWQRSGSRRCS